MTTATRARPPDRAWAEGAIGRLAGWPYGPIRMVSSVKIGVEHGLSGTVHRLTVACTDGTARTLVLKEESARGSSARVYSMPRWAIACKG